MIKKHSEEVVNYCIDNKVSFAMGYSPHWMPLQPPLDTISFMYSCGLLIFANCANASLVTFMTIHYISENPEKRYIKKKT